MKTFVDQCCGFEHAWVINGQPVELLEDECSMTILCDNPCKSIPDVLQLMSVETSNQF